MGKHKWDSFFGVEADLEGRDTLWGSQRNDQGKKKKGRRSEIF